MEGGCRTFDWIRELKREDGRKYKEVCRSLRKDGAYIESSEQDNQTIQQLMSNPGSLAILSFGVLDQNRDRLQALPIEGIKPEFDNVADNSYTISRPLYLYVKKSRRELHPPITKFLKEFTSEKAWGSGGYLSELGLVPMPEKERRKFAAVAKNLLPMTRTP